MRPLKLTFFNLLLPGFLLLYCGCGKPETVLQLPPLTHTGANIIAFEINGKVFISSGASGKLSQFGPGVYYEVYGDSNAVISGTADNPGFLISMGSKYKFALGTYKIDTTPFSQGAVYDEFKTDSAHGGYITYTYYDGNILAGTFALDVVNANDSVIHITDGRFDIQNH